MVWYFACTRASNFTETLTSFSDFLSQSTPSTNFQYALEHIQPITRTPALLHSLANSPLTIQLFEQVVEQEKKHSKKEAEEEAYVLVGEAKLELLPLLQGRTQIASWIPIVSKNAAQTPAPTNSRPASAAAVADSASAAPSTSTAAGPLEVFVTVQISQPLLSLNELEHIRFLRISLDQVYNLPANWLADADKAEDADEHVRQDAEAAEQKLKRSGKKPEARPAGLKVPVRFMH